VSDVAGPVLGLDLGGTKVSALVVDGSGSVLARDVAPTPTGDLAHGLATLGQRTLATARVGPGELVAIGVGSPGSVDVASGHVRFAVNLAPGDVPVGAYLEDRLGAPCFIDHDVRAAARYLAGLEPDCRALGYIGVGTGVAAGIVLDGEPIHGAVGLAGEIGHLVADPAGPRCGCGLAGCLEAIVAGPAIARRAAAARAAAASGGTVLPADPTAVDVYRAAAAGDPVARALAAEVGQVLARAIRGLVLAFGLDRVVVGGGVSRAGATFFEPIVRALDDERAQSELVREAVRPDVVRLLPPEVDAGALGAVTVARAGIRAGGPRVAAPERKEGG